MRKTTRILALAVGAALLFGACSPATAPLGSEAGGVIVDEAGSLAEAPLEVPSETDDAAGETPVVDVPAVDVPVRWEPLPDTFDTAADLVAAITVGWNLGNALDAFAGRSASSIRNNTPVIQETSWGNVLTTEELIVAVRDAGFNAIRVPVTWFAMVDDDLNIREDWFERVEEVVGWAYDAGMIVIINTHHDELMWSLFDDGMDESRAVIETMWRQIADRFEPYGQRLVFEGLNEPRTLGSPAEWSGGTPEERAGVNQLNQVFVDTVRATGGNNANRFLISSPYAASASAAAIDDFVLPTDPAGPDRQIVSIHMYAPYPFALTRGANAVFEWSVDGEGDAGPAAITDGLDRAYQTFVAHGIPVIFGEMGALNRNNLESRLAWATYYVEQARQRGMRTFWWDNGGIGATIPGVPTDHFALINRETIAYTQPELINAIMAAVDNS